MLPAPSTDPGAAVRPTCTTTRHSAPNYAKRRCRCEIGREAWRLYRKRWKTGRSPVYSLDAVGSRRRVQGLMMLGWSRAKIAEAGGLAGRYTYDLIGRVAAGQRKYVTVTTARAIRRAGDLLGAKEGPSRRVRTIAQQLGYIPLWAWDEDTIDDPAATPVTLEPDRELVDEVAVRRAMSGTRTNLTQAERRAAVARLASAPHLLTDGTIADRLHMGVGTVTRIREDAGVPRVVMLYGRQVAA